MKTKYYSLILLLLLSTAAIAADKVDPDKFKGRFTKEKKIKKEYSVNRDALLMVNNKYGNVDVVSWNENRVVIEVTVKTNGNDEDKVASKLEEIDVIFEASSALVSARTEIGKQKSSWWNSWGNSSNVTMEINYKIKVPVSNHVDLTNDYGGISLNKIEGRAKISCDYGHMNLGELLGDTNLSFDYTNNSTIGYLKSGKISADYSTFTVEKAGTVELSADYSKSTFNDVKNLIYSCDYGSLTAEKSGNISGSGDYISLKLGTVVGNVSLKADYGSVKIDRLTAGDVAIESDYAGIKIGYSPDYKFTFKIKLEYSGLTGEENLEMVRKEIKSSDKYYEGFHGSSSAKNKMNINSEYGGVTLRKVN